MINAKTVSVVVPSSNLYYLGYLMSSLIKQRTKPDEVIIVTKGIDPASVEKLSKNRLNVIVIEQKGGFFTQALNIGKSQAKGDIILFTDDDVIAPKDWIYKYLLLHKFYGETVACISSRDIYFDLFQKKIQTNMDDAFSSILFRKFIRPWLQRPHPLLTDYRLGVFLTKKLQVVFGPSLPYKICYSFPFRGVNMSYKNNAIADIKFPEHQLLRKAPGNEQYFGLQLFLKNYRMVFTPYNPVLHIIHESLSRPQNKADLVYEFEVMRGLYSELLKGNQ